MTYRLRLPLLLAVAVLSAQAQTEGKRDGYSDTPLIPGQKWRVHDIDRPYPAVVTPGAEYGKPPSDAVVLFDGRDLSKWQTRARGTSDLVEPKWKVENGYFQVVGRTGALVSREKFGDAQIHIEWAAPNPPANIGQHRGNSGVLLMGRYEIQVLDSYNAATYADGQAAAIYGQWPPLVNASRKPGEWQNYDIVFEAPRFAGDRLVKPAYVTVFHNGVLVHHRQEILGPMAHRKYVPYTPHEAEEPLALQDHNEPVRYRNIWVRRLKGYDQ
ncbi:MAG: DUF1080 domain-containing protein [Bryobacteraceae bacterium]